MKRLLLYIGIAAAILGCTKSEELSTSAADGAISFSAGEIATRVTDGGTTLSWESNEKINVTDGTTSATYTISNTSTGALQYYSGNEFYTYGNSEQTFYGWSPSTLTATEGKLSLDLSDQSAVSQVVVGSAVTATTSATFAFAPIYTKVVFNLTAGGVDVTDLSTATATLSGANVKGDYDYVAGTFSDLAASDITPVVVVDSEDSAKATITAYILETTSMSGELTVSVNGIDFVSSLAGKSWAKGDMYEYNVTVGAILDIALVEGVYQIYSAKGMKAFADLVNGNTNSSNAITSGDGFATFGNENTDINGQLMCDIDLSSICSEASGVNWEPMGYFQTVYDSRVYTGNFDGGGYEISGLYINYSTDAKRQALFGHTSGTIKNLGVSGSVTSTTSGAAGVVAYAYGGYVENCYNKATVIGTSDTGGVAGVSQSSITNCYNTGSVTGTNDVGGVLGLSGDFSSITNCYNTGSVSGSSDVGGVVGMPYGGSVTNCYYLDTSASQDGGSATSMTEDQMTDGTFASTLGTAFKEDYSTPINNGYPILTWQ